MANQYTAGAYAGVKPIQEDFGDDALKAYEITLKNNAQKIALRRQRTEEAKAAQDRLNTYFKDMDEYAAKALNIQPMDFDRGLTDHMVESHRKQIVDAMRIIQDPTKTDAEKIMARSRVRTLSDNALNYVNDRKNMMDLLKDMNNVDTEDGWDSVLSVPVCDAVNRALLSAGEKGTKRNEDGSISAGDYMVQKMGDRGTIITLKTADVLGEDISGTYSEIAAKLKGKMFKTVDLQKELWDYAGKGLQARVREFYRNTPGGLIEVIKQNKWDEIDRMIGEDFDARFPDADSFDKLPVQLRKAIASGGSAGYNSREDVKRAYILAGRNKVKDETNLQLRNDPAFVDEYKRYRMSKGQDSATAPEEVLRQIQSFAQGDDNAINYFVGRKTNLNAPGAKAGDAKIESVEVKDGKIKLTVGGDYEKGFGSNQSKTYTFDTNNPEDQDVLVNALVDSYNQDKTTKQKVEVSQLRGLYDSSVPMVNRGEKKLTPKIERDLQKMEKEFEGKNNLRSRDIEPIISDLEESLNNAGYDVDIDGSYVGGWGNMEISIKKDGEEIRKIKRASGSELAKDLREAVSDILGRNEVSKNDSWILSNRKPGGQTAGNVQSAQKNEPVKQESQTQRTTVKLGRNVIEGITKIVNGEGDDKSKYDAISKYLHDIGYDDKSAESILKSIYKK